MLGHTCYTGTACYKLGRCRFYLVKNGTKGRREVVLINERSDLLVRCVVGIIQQPQLSSCTGAM